MEEENKAPAPSSPSHDSFLDEFNKGISESKIVLPEMSEVSSISSVPQPPVPAAEEPVPKEPPKDDFFSYLIGSSQSEIKDGENTSEKPLEKPELELDHDLEQKLGYAKQVRVFLEIMSKKI